MAGVGMRGPPRAHGSGRDADVMRPGNRAARGAGRPNGAPGCSAVQGGAGKWVPVRARAVVHALLFKKSAGTHVPGTPARTKCGETQPRALRFDRATWHPPRCTGGPGRDACCKGSCRFSAVSGDGRRLGTATNRCADRLDVAWTAGSVATPTAVGRKRDDDDRSQPWRTPYRTFPALATGAGARNATMETFEVALPCGKLRYVKWKHAWYVGCGQLDVLLAPHGVKIMGDCDKRASLGAVLAPEPLLTELRRLGVIAPKGRKAAIIEVRLEEHATPSSTSRILDLLFSNAAPQGHRSPRAAKGSAPAAAAHPTARGGRSNHVHCSGDINTHSSMHACARHAGFLGMHGGRNGVAGHHFGSLASFGFS